MSEIEMGLLEIIDEIQEKEGFVVDTPDEIDVEDTFIVDSDIMAEWCIKKIKEEQADAKRLTDILEYEKMECIQKIRNYETRLESRVSYFKARLEQYFARVEHKKSKTGIESYELPSGKLKLGNLTNEFVREPTKLIKFFEENDYADYIKTTQEPKWGEFKKLIKVVGDKVVTEDGQVVDGVTVVEKPAEFEVVL
jgi:preprotein translocase subunit Sss1